jgi:hypothetical protein
MKKISTIFGIILTTGIFTVSNAQQCLVMNVPLDNRTNTADIIIEGKVTATTPFLNPSTNLIYTSNTIEVYKIIKGNVQTENIEMVTEGGMLDDRWTIVRPSLSLAVGETGIFLCDNAKNDLPVYQSKASNYIPSLSVLGFVKYNLQDLSANDLYTKYSNIKTELYDRISSQAGITVRDLHKFSLEAAQKELRSNAKLAAAPVITSFSPTTVTAGTKTILTINGSGFGATRGTNAVSFYNADNGGSTWVDVNDNNTTADDLYYPKWTDTQIQIYVPARNSSTGLNYFAGTGPVSVVVGGARGTSSGTLTITFSQQEAQSVDGPVPALLGDFNGLGGYTVVMNTNFAANTQAAKDLQTAMNTWSCSDHINWRIGANTSSTTVADDQVNIIRFSNSGELATNTLGATSQNMRVFCGTGATRRWYCTGFDMRYNTQIILSPYTYNMSFGPAAATNSEYDFETVIVHELGHCHQMGHIIKPNYMLHYAINNGQTTRTLHPELAAGGVYNSNTSSATATCNLTTPAATQMTLYTPSSCATGINEKNTNTELTIFPVPVNNMLNIVLNNTSGETLQNIYVYDQLGKEVLLKNFGSNSGLTNTTVNTESLSEGIYFARIVSSANIYNQKIIIAR